MASSRREWLANGSRLSAVDEKLLLDVAATDFWLAQGGENIMALPEEYHATPVAVGDELVILGHEYGSCTFINFDISFLPFVAIQAW
jgi:hypothetical protein